MLMTPNVRKVALTTHVTSSLGWFGSVAAFLSLAIAGVASNNTQLVRSSYVAMELVTWALIVPLSIATLLTGVVQSLGTTWGLFRYHWVIAKLMLTGSRGYRFPEVHASFSEETLMFSRRIAPRVARRLAG